MILANATDGIRLERLSTNDIQAVAGIYQVCDDYFRLLKGDIANQEDVEEFFSSLPPNMTLHDKYSLGIFQESTLIGVIDLIVGYPETDIAYIGLMLINPLARANHVGQRAHKLLIDWLEIKAKRAIQLCVVESNPGASLFWEKLGYVFQNESVVIVADVTHKTRCLRLELGN